MTDAPAAVFEAYNECPETGESFEVEAVFHEGVQTWTCPACAVTHRDEYDDADDTETADDEFWRLLDADADHDEEGELDCE